MPELVNTALLTNPWNWLRIWLMLGIGFGLVYLVSRALPDLVPSKGE